MSYSQIIFVLEIIGTIAFSCSGVAIAKKKEMDVFGAIVLG
ncbi:MAG: TRIC cation channel family protein, partial [Lachnospiraceae bacterium]|nr:TRIC cation channel family protein [Lachnospiraceae bacterium]